MNKYLKAVTANEFFFLINTIAFLVLTPLAIHIMGEEFYGVWSILYSVMLFSGIGALGIGSIVNKFSAEETAEPAESHGSRVLINAALIILPMGVLTAAVLWAAGGLIANNLDISTAQRGEFIIAMRICAVGIIPQFLSKIPNGFLLSQYKNNLVRSMDLVANIFPWLGAIMLSLRSQNLRLIAVWFVIVQTVILLIYLLVIRKHLNRGLQPDRATMQRMLGFSGFMFIESTAISMFQNLDKVIVGFILGPAAAGVYSVGTSVSLRMSMIAGQVTDVMVPYASQKNSLGDNEKLFSVFKRLSRYISLLSAVVGSLLIVWMREILSIWISSDYAAKYTSVFSILIVAYGILSLCRPAHQTLQGIGQVKFSSLLYMTTSILMLACVYLFSVNYALPGAAIANGAMILLLAMNARVYRLMNGRVDWKDLLLALLPGCMVPITVLLLASLFPFLITKICLTVLIATCSTVIILRDPFLREQIGKITGKGKILVED
jgi:O-antigen/teichoic acid export membrane protein